MKTVECRFELPEETATAFGEQVDRDKQGELLAQLIQDWLTNQRNAALREQYIAGLHDMEDVSLELERAYNPLEEEVHRALPE